MALINNTDLITELIAGAKINTASERVPNQIAEKVVPVMEVNPKLLKEITIVRSLTTGGTIYTTPADKDFYLVGTYIEVTNVSATAAGSATITVTPFYENAVKKVNSISTETTAAITSVSTSSNLMLPIPLKLKRGTALTSGVAGTLTKTYIIYGYTVEV